MVQRKNIAVCAGWLHVVVSVAKLRHEHHPRLHAEGQGNEGDLPILREHLVSSALRKSGEASLGVGMGDEPDLLSDYLGQTLWP